MPEYTQIDWTDAECAGIDTENFYRYENGNQRLDLDLYIRPIRALCASCPIWATCLSYAVQHEQFGIWGGMTAVERQAIRDNSNRSVRFRAYQDFAKLGITIPMILETLVKK